MAPLFVEILPLTLRFRRLIQVIYQCANTVWCQRGTFPPWAQAVTRYGEMLRVRAIGKIFILHIKMPNEQLDYELEILYSGIVNEGAAQVNYYA